jgi:hypothetical protein
VYNRTPGTVVLFARSTCAFCIQARPLFLAVIEEARRRPDLGVVLVTTGANRSDELAYAKDLGLDEERVYFLAASALRLRRVPSVAIVNGKGLVEFFREVLEDSESGSEVVQAIRTR